MSLQTTKPVDKEKARNRDDVMQRVFEKNYKPGAPQSLAAYEEKRF